MVARYGGSGERPAETVAREIHALDFLPHVWARHSRSSVEIRGPDSSRRHEHDVGLGFAKYHIVREI